MLIAFEGVIGTGKTSQSKRITEYLKQKFPDKQVIWTREPGGSEIADLIRQVVQGTRFVEEMDPVCEAYLYAASRAQTLRQVVAPVLKSGGIVVSDRSFLTSLANQAFGRELSIEKVLEINRPAIENFIPDHVIFLDLNPDIGMARSFDGHGDKFESLGKDFYDRVYTGYQTVSQHEMFKNKWHTVDASGSVENVYSRLQALVDSF